jgi:hypothetical protein
MLRLINTNMYFAKTAQAAVASCWHEPVDGSRRSGLVSALAGRHAG